MRTKSDRLVARLQRTILRLLAQGYTADAVRGWVNDVLEPGYGRPADETRKREGT